MAVESLEDLLAHELAGLTDAARILRETLDEELAD